MLTVIKHMIPKEKEAACLGAAIIAVGADLLVDNGTIIAEKRLNQETKKIFEFKHIKNQFVKHKNMKIALITGGSRGIGAECVYHQPQFVSVS